jgi:Flp pilus assembly protein TadG
MTEQPRDVGSLSIVMLLLITVVLAGSGLIVDGGRALVARRHAANTAEAAARFAMTPRNLAAGFDPNRAVTVARTFAIGTGLDARDVEARVRYRSDGRPEVVVTITERRAAVFLALTGIDSLTVEASGSAIAVYTR